MRSSLNQVGLGAVASCIAVATCVLLSSTGLVSAKRLKGVLSDGHYTSPRGLFTVVVPKPTNWAGVPYEIQEKTEAGERNYDTVAFYVKDFGQVMMVSVRRIPQVAIDNMAKDDPQNVLKNHADKALFDWRQNFPEEPRVLEDTFLSTPYGQALVRVYSAPHGSLVQQLKGGSGKGFQPLDVVIGVMVVVRHDHYIYAIAENDEAPLEAERLKKQLEELFVGVIAPDTPRFEKK